MSSRNVPATGSSTILNVQNRSGRPTIVDVAAAAGVSRTTASDALNGRGRVDVATRERVIDAASRLGYRANLAARRLRSGKTGILALALPTFEAAGEESEAMGLDYYMRLTGAVAAAAFARGYAVVLMPPLRTPGQLNDIPFDGAILSDPEAADQRLSQLRARDAPVVTIERDVTRADPYYVATSTGPNTRLVLDHLAEKGAKRIALLSPDASWAWIAETTETYQTWSRAHQREEIVIPVPLRKLEGSSYEVCLRLLSAEHRPDALIAVAERYPLGALRAATDLGIRVPEDLMIVAGVDSHASAQVKPGITALDLHPERAAGLAVEMLTARLNQTKVAAPQTVEGDLIIRGSTLRGSGAAPSVSPR
jgi:DNA-binding LacI/PurR family transcriptional regulator